MKTRPSLKRLRLRIKGISTRVLFRGSAKLRTLAALPRKVLCSLPLEHHSRSPTNCTETFSPTKLLKIQVTCKCFCPLFVSNIFLYGKSFVLSPTPLLSLPAQAICFLSPCANNTYSQKIATRSNLLQRNADFKCYRVPEEYI